MGANRADRFGAAAGRARGRTAPAQLLTVLVLALAMGMAGCSDGSASGMPSLAGNPAAPDASPGSTPSDLGPGSDQTARPSPVGAAGTVAAIARLSALVSADPANAEAQRDLGFALAQRVRETADPSLYEPATAAFQAALALQPDDALAMAGVAGIQLGKHEFAAALATARAASALSPTLVAARAAEVDALVELGRYEAAAEAAGEMLGLSVDLTTLARVSYLAELEGDLPTALVAMRRAAGSPGLAPENIAYVQALLGNLLVYTGDPGAAAEAYEAALARIPDHAPSIAGQGRLAVGAGRLDEAIARFERAAAIVPLPEYVIALGDAQVAAGDQAAAAQSFEVARAQIQLARAAGVVVDVDLALLEADHGDPATALDYARAAYASAPTIRAADAVAWALHRLGRDAEAVPFVAEALRLGSLDPVLRYHAGAIEAALGNEKAARLDLGLAIDIDPGFSAAGAAEARRLLALYGTG